ncbi:ribosomal protein S12 methylthiotransferase [Lachnospiraceae bacterium A10]|jgi:ribosomal protein S12 methylthiotransferase|nr:ribosomal protein S12 methylthiotransferase [Lachnospiraceae bacterium A10]
MKVYFASLGCDKNLSDSEHMIYALSEAGMQITDLEEEADVIVVNTCCFIQSALEESINTILELAVQKETGCCKAILVTGCMAERYKEQIQMEMPEVDGIVGTNSYDEIVTAVQAVLGGEKLIVAKPLVGLPREDSGRTLTTGGHYAYLKIADGCDKHCSYCSIPLFKGDYRSVPKEQLIKEAKSLAEKGVKELILVAQETTLYGSDLYGKKCLGELLDELNAIDGLEWIRILYCYPEEIDEDLIEAMKRNDKVLHYLDIPIQHGSSYILGRMGRRTNADDIRAIVKKLREEIPDICIRTTVICGFPGETEEHYQEMLDFINEMEFDRLGAFPYSKEEGTVAYRFENQLDDETKNQRVEGVMLAQQRIAFEKNEEVVGKTMRVMVEGEIPEDHVVVGRTYRDTPNVDGLVFIQNCDRSFMSGDFVDVKIIGTNNYDLIGEIE